MADEVERLVLAPFREIVEKGKTAIENVESAGDRAPALMLKAAQNLVKEGEKALKKIEPVSTANYEEYASSFLDAIKENDDIAQFRSELEDLLWDFDDYVEIDDFDAEKFDTLQKTSRKVAPKIWDILKRMKLVAPAPASIPPPPSVSEAGGPPSLGAAHIYPEELTSIAAHPRSESIERLAERIDSRLSDMMSASAGPDTGLGGDTKALRLPPLATDPDRNSSRHSGLSDPVSERPPTPPSANPWQRERPLLATPEEGEELERRPPVPPDSPTIPRSQLVSPVEEQLSPLRLRRADEVTYWTQSTHDEHDQRLRSASQSHGSNSEGSLSPQQSHRWTNSTQGSTESMRPPPPRSYSGFTHSSRAQPQGNDAPALHGQPHDSVGSRMPSGASSMIGNPSSRTDSRAASAHGHNPGNSLAVNSGFPPRTTSVANHSSSYILSSRKSTESINSSIFELVDSLSPTNPTASAHRHSTQANRSTNPYLPPAQPPPRYPGHPGPPPGYRTPPTPLRRPSGMTARSQSSSVRTAHPGMIGMGAMDEGLIPVDMENSIPNETPMPPRDPDCTISPSSSFYKLKGFCKGAEEAQRGQLGFKRIKRPVGGFSTAVVAKCNHCLFELDFKSVEQDLNNDSSGSFTSNTVGFRLRVLQKSHLQIRNVEEQVYGCLFCIQQGHTNEESDATVFFNQKHLFAHMARHPRPLPRVSGITVIEEPELPPNFKDNFDLHFPHPPTESVMMGISREVARLPVAAAIDTRKISHGTMRLPPDRQAVLHFAVGARIVGIEFPVKYEGKWAMGWHDGVRAAFETDAVQLEAPPKGETRMQATSNVQAIARWKWNQKGDERWLKFDKGEVIKNISWMYSDHWCWSGTTSKGSGIFPQSHLDPNSLRLQDSGDAASISSWEKKHPLKFSIRGRNKGDRKLGSFSSQENNTSRSNVY
ncbi:hypothetical protein F5Y19DRAFT_480768 [Xylariaceae sp. FL1651]|nr:hypothetical protein F5Y19DRAFT_480768 [Xylariaceae sp. FL1651]